MVKSRWVLSGLLLLSAPVLAHTMTVKPLRWQPLREPGSGGWITSFRISPHDARRMILGGDMLGAAVSLDGGQTWGSTFGFRSWEINDATFHPKDPNIVWMGTLMGLYKSSDGGGHFVEMRTGFPPRATFGYSAPIERVLFDPNNINHLIAFGGSSRGWDLPGQKPQFGAVWDSVDAGETWTKIATIGADGNTEDATKGINLYGMEFAAGSSTRLYAVAPSAGFFVSNDGGKTWAKSNAGLPNTKAARVQVHPKDPQTVWISLGQEKVGDKMVPGGIFKSTNGGQSLVSISRGLSQKTNDDANLTANYWAFAVAPGNPDVMYTADSAWDAGVIYATRDGGKNWRAAATKINAGHEQLAALKGAAQVETALPAGLAGTYFAVDPQNPDVAFNVGSEHIIGTRDGGQTWRDMGNDKQADGGWRGRGFAGWCSMNVRFNPYKRDQIALMGLDAARLLLTDNGGKSWQRPLNDPWPWGGGEDACFTPEGWIYVTTGQSGAFQGIARSQDGGKTWKTFYGAAHGLPETGGGKGANEPGGVYALPGAPQKVWATAGDKLYRSVDGGEKWQPVEIGAGLKWLAGDPKNPLRFFVSGAQSVYLTGDGGETWRIIGGPHKAGRMAVDTLGRLYICADEGELGGLWRWDDKQLAVQKWTRVWNDRWIMNIAVDSYDPNRLAFTTNQNPYVENSAATGVWISDDGGKTWRTANDNLPMLRGHAIAFDPFEAGELIYGSYGRGFFEMFWPRTQTLKPGAPYISTPADAAFANTVNQPGTTQPVAQPATTQPANAPEAVVPKGGIIQLTPADNTPALNAVAGNLAKNGSMTEGGVLPDNWTEKWGAVNVARDTRVFKEGPASLRVDANGAAGQAFQMFEGMAGKTLRLSGFIKTSGGVRAQVAIQSFDKDWKKNKFDQAVFLQGEVDWLDFEKEITIPDWATRFNVQLWAEGQGKAWLDEVQLIDPAAPVVPVAPTVPVAPAVPVTPTAPVIPPVPVTPVAPAVPNNTTAPPAPIKLTLPPPAIGTPAIGTPAIPPVIATLPPPPNHPTTAPPITHPIRNFGPAAFDYPYGGWKPANIKADKGFVTIDAREDGGAGVVLNGADVVPQKQTHLALRARLLPGNDASRLLVNLIGSDRTVTFDLTKLNDKEFTTLLEPLPDGKFTSIQQMQIQGTNWSAAAQPLKLQIEAIGTTGIDEKANATALEALAKDPTQGPPPKDKPSVPGWGFYPQFPQGWMQTHNSFVERTNKGVIPIIFFGDSITQGWGTAGKEVWDKYYAPLGAVNYGIGGDGTRQVLWRIQNGEIDGLSPKLIVVNIGTNNLYDDFNAGSDEEIAAGIQKIVATLREKLPTTKILVLGILPRQNDYFSNRTRHINELIKPIADGKTVRFLDMSNKFQTQTGKVIPDLYTADQLHFAKKGYELWAATMKPVFDEMVK